MTKDYANKRVKNHTHSSSRQRSQSNSALPGWIWLFSGVFLGIGLAIFIFWKWGQNYHYQPPQPPIVVTESDVAPLQEPTEDPENAKNRFDFYTLLPNLKVEMPDVETPAQLRQAEKPAQESPLVYILQAGSFKVTDQAEKLKATLALNGFESQIQTVKIPPNETWYRVYIGPFPTKSEALVMQQNLKQNLASNSLILKIRV